MPPVVVVRVLAALVLVVLPGPACAAFEVSWPDARTAALLSPAHVRSPGHASPRAYPDSTETPGRRCVPRVTVSAGELYGVREAAGWGVCASAPFRRSSVGVELSRLGGELYEERALSLSFDLEVDPDLALRARVRGLGIAARGLDERWAVALDAGVTRRLLGRVLLGAESGNLTRSRIGDSPVAARTHFFAALALPSVMLRWTLLLEGEFDPATVVGFEARLTEWLRLRAGARDAPGRLGFGFGVGKEGGGPWPVIDVAVQWHPELGVSSFVSVTVEP